ncbi:MAG: efflux RND transporter periplasmic adaptor subunit [Alphaproteobacteria bacterium]
MNNKIQPALKIIKNVYPIIIVLLFFWLLIGVKVPVPSTPAAGERIQASQKVSVLRYILRHSDSDKKGSPPQREASGLKAVSILTIGENKFTPTLDIWGEVQSASGSALELVSEIAAQVVDVTNISPGSSVKAGDVLVTLDKRDATYKLEQAQAKLDELNASLASAQALLPLEEKVVEVAEKAYERYQNLAKSNVASTANLETQLKTYLQAQQAIQTQKSNVASLEAQIKSQEAVLNEAKYNLEKTQIKAPVDGRILEIKVQKGQFLSANTTILRMVNINEQEVQASVSFSNLVSFLPHNQNIDDLVGLKGFFTIEENGYKHDWPIKVKAIPTELSSESRDIKIHFSFDNPISAPLLGTYGSITLISPEDHNVIVVPRDSIRQGKAYILDAENKIHAKDVKTSIIGDKWLWVQEGLSLNDKLVVQPPIPFVEGIEYEPQNNQRTTTMLNEFIEASANNLATKGANNND